MHFADFHPRVLRLPFIERHRADPCPPAELFHRSSTLRFSQYRNDLLLRESTPLHGPLLSVLYPEQLTFVWIKFRGARQLLFSPQTGKVPPSTNMEGNLVNQDLNP